jgi:hypothetical protein
LVHLIAANLDTVYAQTVPVGRNLAVLLVLRFADNECGDPHPVEMALRHGGARLLELQAQVTAERPEHLPADWPVRGQLAASFGILFPEYGRYAFDFHVGGEVAHSLNL